MQPIKSYDIPQIMEVEKIIRKDPTVQYSDIDLAIKAGINVYKLRIGFKQIFHTTIHQYRLGLRLEIAKNLLDQTDMTVAEIAYKAGFDTRDGLRMCFQRKFNKCPREWRIAAAGGEGNSGLVIPLSIPEISGKKYYGAY